MNYLIGPIFPGLNVLFVLSFKDKAQRTSYKRYYLSTVEIKNYNGMIDGQNIFDQHARNDLKTYDSIQKIAKG